MAEDFPQEVQSEAHSSLRETLAQHTAFTGIDGKQNGLISFNPDRDEFLRDNATRIAHIALQQGFGVGGSRYAVHGLRGIELAEFKNRVKSLPNLEILNNYMKARDIYAEGGRDFLTYPVGEAGVVSYSWLPASESTGDMRIARNIMVAEMSGEALEQFKLFVAENPLEVYDLLISGLFPNSLIPLSEQEILDAVRTKGPELLRLATAHQSNLFQKGITDPRALVDFVSSRSTLKRRNPCETVQITEVR